MVTVMCVGVVVVVGVVTALWLARPSDQDATATAVAVRESPQEPRKAPKRRQARRAQRSTERPAWRPTEARTARAVRPESPPEPELVSTSTPLGRRLRSVVGLAAMIGLLGVTAAVLIAGLLVLLGELMSRAIQ
jgi:hypothetical protein